MTTRPAGALPAAALAAAGGALLYLAFPPVAARPVALVAPALLLLAVRHQTARRGAWLGAVFGIGVFAPLLTWLQFAGVAPWIAVTALEVGFLALTGAALAAVSRLPWWPLWSAAVWVAGEALRARVPFGGFTWGRLAFSQDDGPLTRWASVVGVPGLSLVVALLAALAACAAVHLGRRRGEGDPRAAAAAVAAMGAVIAAGPLLPGPPGRSATTTVALVQGNVPRLGLDFNAQRQRVLRNHVEATLELARQVDAGTLPAPDLVIWPENSTDIDPRRDAEVAALLTAAAQAIERPVLVGAVLDTDDGRALNAGIVWDPRTGPGAQYVKRHLVPYGEYVPFRRQLQPLFGQLALVPRDFTTRDEPGVLDLNGVTIGDVICFEVSYDGLVRDVVRGGGEVLVVQTNNATFERSAETRQQLAMARLRAVEHGRAVLVAATSGISAVIEPDGSFVDRSAVFTRDLLVAEVPRVTALTPATRLGDWPEAATTASALAALGVAAGRRPRRRGADAAVGTAAPESQRVAS